MYFPLSPNGQGLFAKYNKKLQKFLKPSTSYTFLRSFQRLFIKHNDIIHKANYICFSVMGLSMFFFYFLFVIASLALTYGWVECPMNI